MTTLLGILAGAALFAAAALIRPRGCTGQCEGCAGDCPRHEGKGVSHGH